MDIQELKSIISDLQNRMDDIKDNIFKIESKKERLIEIENQLSKEEVWSDLDLSQKLSKEKTSLEKTISSFKLVCFASLINSKSFLASLLCNPSYISA